VGLLNDLKDSLGLGYDFSDLSGKDVLDEMPEVLNTNQSISMILLLEDEKPGVLIMSADDAQRAFIEAFCDEFNCSTMEVGGVKDPGVFVSKNPDRFEILRESSGDFYGAEESAVGKFLGYEKKARTYYEEMNEKGKLARKKFEKKLKQLEQSGDVPEGYDKYLELIAYIPYPDKQHIMQAIKRGEKRYRILEQHQAGKKLLERLKQETEGKDPVSSGL
jgi:hypothetical protein